MENLFAHSVLGLSATSGLGGVVVTVAFWAVVLSGGAKKKHREDVVRRARAIVLSSRDDALAAQYVRELHEAGRDQEARSLRSAYLAKYPGSSI